MRPLSSPFFATDKTKRSLVFLPPSLEMDSGFVPVLACPIPLGSGNDGGIGLCPSLRIWRDLLAVLFLVFFLPNIALGFSVAIPAHAVSAVWNVNTIAGLTRDELMFLGPHKSSISQKSRRYSLNCTVMCRSGHKEAHDNKLETPFFTMAKRTTARAVLHEWQTDALLAAATNRNVEGDDPAANTGTSVPTSRLGMYCQISAKYAVISDTQQAVDKAGRSNEMSYQIAKRLGELKRKQHCAVFA